MEVTRGPSRRCLLGLAPLVLGRAGRAWAAGAGKRTVLYLQPLGAAFPTVDAALVEEGLRVMIGLDVRMLATAALPAAAFFAPRRRYRAEKLLEFLNTRLPADGARILGICAVDISTTKGDVADWGILGLGQLPGTASVISSFRCRRRASGPEHARQRLAKVAVHEIGHTLGLDHCPNRGCLMEDAQGLVITCDREYDFCARCRGLQAAAGRRLPATPRIPWPRPAL